jgi:hypothetical protein
MSVKEQLEKLQREILALRKLIEELKDKPSEYPYPYPNDGVEQKCYSMNMSREEQLIQEIRNSQEFKDCMHSLMDTNGVRNVSVKFTYTPDKPKPEWVKDGLDHTREIISNNISNPEIRKTMDKKYLVKDIDSKGDAIIYPDW